MNTKEISPKWREFIDKLYQNRYKLLGYRLYNNIIALTGEPPPMDIINDLFNNVMNELGRNSMVDPTKTLFNSIERYSHLTNLTTNFPLQSQVIFKTIAEIKKMSKEIMFTVDTEYTFEVLSKVPIFCN